MKGNKKCNGLRERYVEDILEDVRTEVTKHIIHRNWCPKCRKMVEPVVTDALPKVTIGNGIVVLSAWLHFALVNTILQILEIFNFHLQFDRAIASKFPVFFVDIFHPSLLCFALL